MSCCLSSVVILLILRHGWITRAFPPARKNGEKEQDANERTLTRTVRHRSLHGSIKTNVSVSGSVAASVSVHMESCTVYVYFLDFCRSRFRIRIRTNEIAPFIVFFHIFIFLSEFAFRNCGLNLSCGLRKRDL